MQDQFSRTRLLLGAEGVDKLWQSRVLVFGIGGVGGFCIEALARAGVGTIGLCDGDKICPSNLNRQLHAIVSTLGQYKTDAAHCRIADINPKISVQKYPLFYTKENARQIDLSKYDYIVDAIDTVDGKVTLASMAQDAGIPLISCMGTGNKLDPTLFEVADIFETSVCPLAKAVRQRLRDTEVKRLKVVYSKEQPLPPHLDENRRPVPGSISFVPSVAGLILAGEVIKYLIKRS